MRFICKLGSTITQAVSRLFHTAAARVLAQVRSCRICGGQIGAALIYSEYFSFLCHSFHLNMEAAYSQETKTSRHHHQTVKLATRQKI
jgi:hypothetical protein